MADYYINGLPEVGEWHDTHIRMEGEVVALLQDIFLKIWNKQTKQHIGGEVYYPIDVYRGTDMEEDSLNSEVSIVDREPKVTLHSPKPARWPSNGPSKTQLNEA